MINPIEAPKGYMAVKGISNLCEGCVCRVEEPCFHPICEKEFRRDGENVIFIKEE